MDDVDDLAQRDVHAVRIRRHLDALRAEVRGLVCHRSTARWHEEHLLGHAAASAAVVGAELARSPTHHAASDDFLAHTTELHHWRRQRRSSLGQVPVELLHQRVLPEPPDRHHAANGQLGGDAKRHVALEVDERLHVRLDHLFAPLPVEMEQRDIPSNKLVFVELRHTRNCDGVQQVEADALTRRTGDHPRRLNVHEISATHHRPHERGASVHRPLDLHPAERVVDGRLHEYIEEREVEDGAFDVRGFDFGLLGGAVDRGIHDVVEAAAHGTEPEQLEQLVRGPAVSRQVDAGQAPLLERLSVLVDYDVFELLDADPLGSIHDAVALAKVRLVVLYRRGHKVVGEVDDGLLVGGAEVERRERRVFERELGHDGRPTLRGRLQTSMKSAALLVSSPILKQADGNRSDGELTSPPRDEADLEARFPMAS
ncbi:hypothetical protein ON010_g12469 [Phytophthora cinnamomi]|nr:hypothetical protein ON010_g12469 [Phytophthora cinnamomi]